MRLGEICLLHRDVPRLAAFYAALLGMNTATDDPVHQTIMAEETMLTILHDDHAGDAPTASIAFSVEDVEAEARRILSAGYDRFRRKDGQAVYEVLGSKLCKVVAPEGTIIELRDTAEL